MTEKASHSCGSSVCLLDGLEKAIAQQGESLKAQHLESREFMKELMMTHVGHLTTEMAKTNKALEALANNLYPAVRQVSDRVTKIEVAIGLDGLDQKLEKAIGNHEDVKWAKNRREFSSAVAKFVVGATIIAVVSAGIGMYTFYLNLKDITTQLQHQRPSSGTATATKAQ